MTRASEPRLMPADLAAVVLPSAPVAWGDRIAYVLRRTDAASSKAFSAIWVVPRAGGAAHRLTQGNYKDRLLRADPRGEFLVFVSDRLGLDQLFRLDASGGDARPLTALPRGMVLDLAVSPDGTRIAVLFSPAWNDDALPLAAELARAALPDALPDRIPGAGASAAPPEPAAAGRVPRARVTARLRNREDGQGWLGDRAHLWIVDARTGDARRLTRGSVDYAFPAWTPGGEALVACASRPPDDTFDCDGTRNDLVRIDADSGAIAPIAKPEGAAMTPAVSPKGDLVAYVLWQPGDDFGHDNAVVWVSPLGAGEPRPLTAELDRTAMDMIIDDLGVGGMRPERPIWSGDGARVVATISDRGSVRLFEQPLDGRPGCYLTAERLAVGSAAPCSGGEIAAVVADAASFPEIAVLSAEPDAPIRILTAHNRALAERCRPTAPERVSIEQGGVALAAYYYAPRGLPPGARAPALLYVHGGPCVGYGERLFFEMQWLAGLGYAVLCPNPRGSQGYGNAYTSAIRGRWGEPDRGDQLAFADWLAARPEVDPARIGVAGGSYGGYMTLLLCATSTRFRAAIAERGLYNWASLVGSSDFGHTHARIFGGKWPWEEPGRYLEASPMRLVGEVKTPTLIVHQEGDLRVGTEQALQLFAALKLRGVPTALLLFPEEDHGMTRGGRIDRRLERMRQIEAWLAAWLRDPPVNDG